MAQTLKVLGQGVAIGSATPVDIYTVPAATTAAISSVSVCNQNAADITFYLQIRVAGAVDDPSQYIYYNATCPGYDTVIATIGMTLSATDVITIYSNNSNISFNVFGTENT